ncbi:MAG: ABC transporter substrate-binding protein [Variibacter sp.]
MERVQNATGNKFLLRNRHFALATLMLALAVTLPATARAEGPAGLVTPSTLTVCMDPTYPPMEFFKATGDADPVGFDVDLATALAKEWGLSLRLMKMDFAGLLPAVQAGRCDMLISGATVQEKRTKVLPAVPYLKTGRAILVRKDKAADIKSPDDLSGRTVAIQTGTSFVDVAKSIDEKLKQAGKPGLNVQPYPKATEVFEQLRNGRADAVITNETEIAYRATLSPGAFVTAYTFPEREVFGIYFKPSPQTKTALDSTLAKLRSSNAIKALATKWGMPEANADISP